MKYGEAPPAVLRFKVSGGSYEGLQQRPGLRAEHRCTLLLPGSIRLTLVSTT